MLSGSQVAPASPWPGRSNAPRLGANEISVRPSACRSTTASMAGSPEPIRESPPASGTVWTWGRARRSSACASPSCVASFGRPVIFAQVQQHWEPPGFDGAIIAHSTLSGELVPGDRHVLGKPVTSWVCTGHTMLRPAQMVRTSGTRPPDLAAGSPRALSPTCCADDLDVQAGASNPARELTSGIERCYAAVVKIENDFRLSQACQQAWQRCWLYSHRPDTPTRAPDGLCWLRSTRAADKPALQSSWLWSILHHPALGFMTVYRTLDVLLTLRLVRKLHWKRAVMALRSRR